MDDIEVVHIPMGQRPLRTVVQFMAGMTVGDVLEQSDVLKNHPELCGLAVGIFSRAVSLDTEVKRGDRIEIYRPLTLDPMEIRRQRAKKKPRTG